MYLRLWTHLTVIQVSEDHVIKEESGRRQNLYTPLEFGLSFLEAIIKYCAPESGVDLDLTMHRA